MITDTLKNASAAMQGALDGNGGSFCGISTDTRTLKPGELFFALQGPNYDGGAFVTRAASARAAAAVVKNPVDAALPRITVDDTRKALGMLAASWRRQMPATVVGLTGSNGKTTLKQLLSNGLSLAGPTLATRGNLNNEIGVPLMLSEMNREHRYAVIEMGANHPGEIAYLTSLAEPDVVVITNAAPAHLEGFGSLEGVARAKGEILQGGKRPKWAVLNADDRFYALWESRASDLQILTFGLGSRANVRAVDLALTAEGSRFRLLLGDRDLPVKISLPGRHNVYNACAAAAVASVLGVHDDIIVRGLETARPVAGRLSPVRGAGGVTIYDDSYNANPSSVVAGAEFVAAQGGEPWLVLGDMGELGKNSARLHRTVGEAVREAGVKRLFATGKLTKHTVDAFGDNAHWFETLDELVAALQQAVTPQAVVLVKGSRAMHMERVVYALQNGQATERRA